jgi:ParB/RepB/Spo0J family partition protein
VNLQHRLPIADQNVRQDLDEAHVSKLVESIRDCGLLHPITVVNGSTEPVIVAGRHRYAALLRIHGSPEAIPPECFRVIDATDVVALLGISFDENEVRLDLSPMERAQATKRFREALGLTQAAMGERLGVTDRRVAQVESVLEAQAAPESVRADLERRPSDRTQVRSEGQITEAHWRHLRRIEDRATQEHLARRVKEKDWSAKRLAEEVGRILSKAVGLTPDPSPDLTPGPSPDLTPGPSPTGEGRLRGNPSPALPASGAGDEPAGGVAGSAPTVAERARDMRACGDADDSAEWSVDPWPFREQPQATTVWRFAACDPRFGMEYPGRLPGQLVANVVRLCTEPGDLVIDPFAGSGTTIDVCQAMGREVLAGDLRPSRADILEREASEFIRDCPTARLVFLDPPYWRQKADEYTDDDRDMSGIEASDTFDSQLAGLVATARRAVGPGGYVALIVGPTVSDGVLFDHAASVLERMAVARIQDEFSLRWRVIVPYADGSTPKHLFEAKCVANRTLMAYHRDLMIWQRGDAQ